MGILPVLRGLGRRDLAALRILSIPDTDNVTLVSPIPFLITPLSPAYVFLARPS